MKLVNIESPYAGDIEANVAYARRCMADCLKRGEAPIASHLLYTQPGILDDLVPEERLLGIHAGFAWNDHAETTVVYTDLGISKGMQYGIDAAKAAGRYVEYRSFPANTLPQIIAISGRRGAGKDTVADLIQSLQPAQWHRASFAARLKEFAQQLTGHQDMFSQEGKTTFLPEWGMTAGELLQKLGTDAIRNGLHENAWVLACFAGMKPDGHYIITDCRFPNEADAIRAKGGIVIRVEGDPLKQQSDGTRDDNHPSEVALDDYPWFDAIIDNTGTLDQLKGHVRLMLEHIADSTPESRQMCHAPYNHAVYTSNVTTYVRRHPRHEIHMIN